MKQTRDPSAKHELLEILRREGVGFKFTLIDAERWLPHFTQSNIAGVISCLWHGLGVLKKYDDVPHPKKDIKRKLTRYQVLGAIRKDIRTKGSIKFGERHRTSSHSEAPKPSTDRVDRGAALFKKAMDSFEVARARFLELGVIAQEPTNLDLIPEAKLAASLRRRGWTLLEPKGFFVKQVEQTRVPSKSTLASFMSKQIGTLETPPDNARASA